jgi:plastocyanin
MIHKTILMGTMLIVVALALVACGGGATTGGGASAVSITVTLTEFKFDPATITVAPGQTVNLTVKNTGSIDHTFVIPSANVKVTAGPGKTETKTFTAPTAAGTYDIDCDIAGHKEAGMVGKLVVK